MKRVGILAVALLCLNSAQPPSNSFARAREVQTQPAARIVDEVTRLNEQALVLVEDGKLDEALSVAKQSLDIADKQLGSQHNLVGVCAYNLATIYFAKKQYYDAAKFYQRSLSVYEKTLGPNDPKLADALYGLGWVSSIRRVAQVTKPSNSTDVRFRCSKRPLAKTIDSLANCLRSARVR